MEMEEIKKHVNYAQQTGWLMAILALTFSLLSLVGNSIGGVSIWGLIDVAAIVGLTYGIRRYSRVCTIILLLYLLVNATMYAMESGKTANLGLAAVFVYFLMQGIRGTFAYHRLKKSEKNLDVA
jgi:hypothetical protein